MANSILEVTTIGAQLAANARNYPQREALVFPERGLRLTWAQLDRDVDQVARGLLALGLEPGGRVALWALNRPAWVLVFYAAARLGAVTVGLDTALQPQEFARQMQQSQATLLLMGRGVKGDEYIEALAAVRDELPALRKTVLLSAAPETGLLSFAELLQLGDTIPGEQLRACADTVTVDHLVNIQYTSAALGVQKGVLLTHRQILGNGTLAGRNLRMTPDDRLCLALPLFHAFGCSLGMLLCLAHGATLVVLQRFAPGEMLARLSDERCTAMHGVPTMFKALLTTPGFEGYDLRSLRTGIMAGAPCPVELMEEVIEKLHARQMTIAYGQTEAGPLITQTPIDDPPARRATTVGVPLPGVEVRIVDPVTGQDCPDQASGELWARSPMVMLGYDAMPEETAAAIDADGWLHTGDLALRDADGYYRITGRLRNMVIRGGQNIYPVEVEQALLKHPGIAQVRVHGLPDDFYGEIVAARVVCRPETTLDAGMVTDFLKGRLAPYKIPARVEFVDEL